MHWDVSGMSEIQVQATPRISRKRFQELSAFITGEVGIKMPPSKVSMVESRLGRRVRELGLHSIDAYCARVFSGSRDDDEYTFLINALTTNKTDFFREPFHYRMLTHTVLPELMRAGFSTGKLRLWSAACSSGEEPYTLAMVLSEYAEQHPGFDYRIFATDISTRVLQIARDAIYPRNLIEPVPKPLRAKYLLTAKDSSLDLVRIRPELRSNVRFHQLNLMDSDYHLRDKFDVIFCRNVLIYFSRETQEAVIGKLCRHLSPGGYLFVSHSESLAGLNLPVHGLGHSCYRRLSRG